MKSHVLRDYSEKLYRNEHLGFSFQGDTMTKVLDIYEILETWTRTGKRNLVIETLKKTDFSKYTLEETILIGKIANRNHLYNFSLRLLFKRKQELQQLKIKLPEDLITTYATALLGIGATEEAQDLLSTIQNHLPALLSYAISFFSSWNYEAAIPLLKKYLKMQKDEYLTLVGRINLIAAIIGIGDYQQGQILLEKLKNDLKDNPKASVLYGNCWEIQSQIDIENKEYHKALASLAQAKLIFKDQLTRYLLYVNKWEAISHLALSPEDEFAKDRVRHIIHEAKILRNWETIRDCEFQFARFTNNVELIQKNLLGTPYSGYHKRLNKLYQIKLEKTFSFNYSPRQYFHTPNSLEKFTTQNPVAFSDSHQACSLGIKIFNLLLKDFYKPARLGVIHHYLYPNNYFNPYTSAHNIRNQIYRFNKISDAKNIPIKIYVEKGDTFLKTTNLKLIISPLNKQYKNKDQHHLNKLIQFFKGQSFTAKAASHKLNISVRKVNSIIKLGITKNKIKRLAQGRTSSYKLSNQSK